MTQTRFDDAFAPIAVAVRSGFDESLHHGAGVVFAADGSVTAWIGDPGVEIYPRSSLKPLQAYAMVGLGLELPPDLLALACASHSGEAIHLDGVRRILDAHGLVESDLQNTPARPYGDAARDAARRAGIAPSPLQHNCSGKHAAMLATCRINGWPTTDYLDERHVLQRAITEQVNALAGTLTTSTHIGIDGCGAPAHTMPLAGLAAAFSSIARFGSVVAKAMAAHPEMVGGSGRDVSAWIGAIDGLVAKEGAAGVMAVAMPDGRAAALKIADGSDSARQAVAIHMMRLLGIDEDIVQNVAPTVVVPVLGHGIVVGEVRALDWSR